MACRGSNDHDAFAVKVNRRQVERDRGGLLQQERQGLDDALRLAPGI